MIAGQKINLLMAVYLLFLIIYFTSVIVCIICLSNSESKFLARSSPWEEHTASQSSDEHATLLELKLKLNIVSISLDYICWFRRSNIYGNSAIPVPKGLFNFWFWFSQFFPREKPFHAEKHLINNEERWKKWEESVYRKRRLDQAGLGSLKQMTPGSVLFRFGA